jgi:hypothetical protein
LLTLLVVPGVYTYLDDIGSGLAHWWRRKTPAHAPVNHGVAEQVR